MSFKSLINFKVMNEFSSKIWFLNKKVINKGPKLKPDIKQTEINVARQIPNSEYFLYIGPTLNGRNQANLN